MPYGFAGHQGTKSKGLRSFFPGVGVVTISATTYSAVRPTKIHITRRTTSGGPSNLLADGNRGFGNASGGKTLTMFPRIPETDVFGKLDQMPRHGGCTHKHA